MRITKLQLDPEEAKAVEELTDAVISENKDVTLAYDFSKDIYSLFKEKVSRRRIIKSYWDIFKDVRALYARHKTMDLMKNVDFYGRVRGFLRYLIVSHLFHEMDKLDPIDALEAFLNMFQPPQQQQQQQNQSQSSGQNKDDEQQQQQDQDGTSADEDNIPIDMTEFRQSLPSIERALDSGIMDSEDFQQFLGKKAGIGHNDLKIGNIKNTIDKISKSVSDRELEIFYVARKKEATDLYRRDEVLESVQFPEDEMNINTIDSPMDILKTVPTQYAYDDDVFMQKLVKKELLIRDYQARRLKKQVLYILVDISGSMSGTKNIYACGVSVAFIRQSLKEGSTYFLRFFDSSPHDMHTVKSKADAEKLEDMLLKQPFSGGGTNIQAAVLKAVDDITKSPENFEKAEIMIISDGEDRVSLDKEMLKGVKIHTTIIDGRNTGLKDASDTYIELDSNELIG